tara:strand:- start:136 stop:561 length:426 start_codon:yes stop_codon:yes gene_type:complete
MKQASSTERSQRQLRVAEQIRHVLTEVLQRGKFFDEALMDAAHITVAEVRISPDLKKATAYALPGASRNTNEPMSKQEAEDSHKELVKALNKAHGYFQKEIAHQLNLKFTPRVHFVHDKAFNEAGRIEHLIQKIHHERGES